MYYRFFFLNELSLQGSSHERQKPQAPTPQAPIRNRQTRKNLTGGHSIAIAPKTISANAASASP